jgi:hypothetical protein
MKHLLSTLLLAAALCACSGESRETAAAEPLVDSPAMADTLAVSQPDSLEQDLGAQSLKTTQEVDSLLEGI